MDFLKLKTAIETPELVELSNAAIAEQLNAPNLEYFVTVPTSDVHDFLVSHGLYAKLLGAFHSHPSTEIRIIAETGVDTVMGQIPELNLGENPIYRQMFGALVTGQVFTQAEADSVLNLAKRTRSRAEIEFGVAVTQGDIQIARNQDALAEVQSLLEHAATAYGDVLVLLQDVQSRLRAGEVVAVPEVESVATRFSEALA